MTSSNLRLFSYILVRNIKEDHMITSTLLLSAGGGRDGEEDQSISSGLSTNCSPLIYTVLLNNRSSKYRSNVSIFAYMVRQPLHLVHTRKVG